MTGRPGEGHPYSKLLEELDGARLVRFDRPGRRVLAWRGGRRVDVFNLEGALSDFFTVPDPQATAEGVSSAIDAWLADESEE